MGNREVLERTLESYCCESGVRCKPEAGRQLWEMRRPQKLSRLDGKIGRI